MLKISTIEEISHCFHTLYGSCSIGFGFYQSLEDEEEEPFGVCDHHFKYVKSKVKKIDRRKAELLLEECRAREVCRELESMNLNPMNK